MFGGRAVQFTNRARSLSQELTETRNGKSDKGIVDPEGSCGRKLLRMWSTGSVNWAEEGSQDIGQAHMVGALCTWKRVGVVEVTNNGH